MPISHKGETIFCLSFEWCLCFRCPKVLLLDVMHQLYSRSSPGDGRLVLAPLLRGCRVSDMESYRKLLKKKEVNDIFQEIECISSSFRMLTLLQTAEFLKSVAQLNAFMSLLERFFTCDRKVKDILLRPEKDEEETAMEERGFFDLLFSSFLDICRPFIPLSRSEAVVSSSDGKRDKSTEECDKTPSKKSGVSLVVSFVNALNEDLHDVFLEKLILDWLDCLSKFSVEETYLLISELCWKVEPLAASSSTDTLNETKLATPILQSLVKVFQLKFESCSESEGKDWFWLSKLLTKLVSVFEKFSSDCAIDMSEATESLKSTRLLYGQIFKCLMPDSFRCAVDSLHGYIRQNTESENESKLKVNLNLLRLLLLQSHDRGGVISIPILCGILKSGVSSCFSLVADLIENEVRSSPELFAHFFIFASELLVDPDSELPNGIVDFFSKIMKFCSDVRPIKSLALQNGSEFLKLSESLLRILSHQKTKEDLALLVLRQIISLFAASETVPDALKSSEAVDVYCRYAPLKSCRLLCTTCLSHCLSDGRQCRQAELNMLYEKDIFDLDTFISCFVSQAVSTEVFRLSCELTQPDGVSAGKILLDKLLNRLGDDSKLIMPKLQAVLELIEDEEMGTSQTEVQNSISWRLRSWLKQRSDVLLTFVCHNLEEPKKAAAAALDLLSVVLKLSRDERKRLVKTVLPKVDYFNLKRRRDRNLQKLTDFWNLFSVDVSEGTSRSFESLSKEDFEKAVSSLRQLRENLGSTPQSVDLETKLSKGVSVFPNNEQISVFGQTFDLFSAPSGFEDHVPPESVRLVYVASTKRNILRVLKCQQSLEPILLEGDTGVGKSAAVTEAARLLRRPIIRFNMSRSVTCSDIIGHVSLCSKSSQLVQFEPGPFTAAFENGLWLLLDELNLSSDEVLQCIELALDTGRLVVEDYSSDRGRIEIKKHKNFLLFATQNPNAGGFKGMREVLSDAFISRFQTLSLEPPAKEELVQILTETFQNKVPIVKDQRVIVRSWANRMVECHEQIKLEAMSQPFLHEGPNAIFTVRELLKWVGGVIAAVSGEGRRFSVSSWRTDKDKINEMFAVEAFCVYGTRFRSSLCRQAVHDLALKHFSLTKSAESDIFALQFVPQTRAFQIYPYLKITFSDDYEAEQFCHYEEMIQFHRSLSNELLALHNSVFLPFLVPDWAKMGFETLTEVATAGYELYAKHLPVSMHDRLGNVLKDNFGSKLTFPTIQNQNYTNFVVTPYIMKLWFYILHAVKHSQPVLLVGAPGSGKSEILLQLAAVVGKQMSTWCITPETESSDLVGKIVPKEPAEWNDGVVTRSVRKGQWVLLDNLLDADSAVLERLNPLLESNPSWILTENGKTSNLFLDDQFESFRFFSTATVSELDKSLGKMSPAFANRLTIIHVDDCAFSDVGLTSLGTLAWNLYERDPEMLKRDTSVEYRAVQVTSTFLLNVKREFPILQGGPLITLRTLVRVAGGAKSVLCDHPDVHVTDALYTCCQLFVFQQLNRSAENRLNPLFKELKKSLQKLKGSSPCFIDFLSGYDDVDEYNNYILDPDFTPTRYRYGNLVLFGIQVKLPVLLEGPAATGKTSLIESIGRLWGQKGCLHRVINSDSTSVQDYLGTFVPCGDGKFERLSGPLRTAMEQGRFFLCDEFNLADPSVLNMLLPLLEGRRLIYDPVSGETIYACEKFRFFATQNSATYADRKRLSVGLRSRFIEAQVKDFDEGELAYILQHRKYSSSREKSPFLGRSSRDPLAMRLEKACIKINEAVRERRLHLGSGNSSVMLTLREMIKWIERYVVLSDVSENRKVEHLLGRAGLSLLVPRLRTSSSLSTSQSEEKLKAILVECGLLTFVPTKTVFSVAKTESDGCLLSDGFAKKFLRSDIVSQRLSSRLIPKDYKLTFARIHMAVDTAEPVLLVGPTTFKTTIAEDYFKIRNVDFAVIQLSSDTQVSDLLGQMHPFSFEAATQELLQTALQLCHCVRTHSLSFSAISESIAECKRFLDSWRRDNRMGTWREEASEGDLRLSENDSDDATDDDSEFDDEELAMAPAQQSYESHGSGEQFLSTDEDEGDEDDSTGYSDDDDDEYKQVTVASRTKESSFDPNSEFLSKDSDKEGDDDDVSSSAESKSDEVFQTEEDDLVLTSSEKFHFPACLENLRDAVAALNKTSSTPGFLISKFLSTFDILRKSASDTSKPVFLFKDGPVTLALKEEKSLFFEDLDLPSQAVIERLNSLLEPGRVLFLSEDVSVGVQANIDRARQVFPGIQMPASSAIFATVHAEGGNSKGVNLSPALRSRFSEIIIPGADICDVIAVAENLLENSSLPKNRVHELIDVVKKLTEGLQSESKLFSLKTVTNLITIVDSLFSAQVQLRERSSPGEKSINLSDLVAVASKIVIVDQCDNDRKSVIDLLLRSLNVGLEESGTLVQRDLSKQILSWLCEGAEGLTEGNKIWEPLDFLEPVEQWICHKTLPVAAKVSRSVPSPVTKEHVEENFKFTATPTCIDNFVRVVVCLSSNLPLLLQGPPGIGKTAVVQQCGDLFGYAVERINFTKDTTIESLIGSYVPTWNETKLVFQWRAGKALTAIESGHFLLLDEINLASQEVLDEIKAMINPRLKSYYVKGLGKSVEKHADFRLFATMNPESVGGGRTKLPRSIENAFLQIRLQHYSRNEEGQICIHQFAAKDLVPGLLKRQDVGALLDLHFEVKTMIDRREIGRRGGPYELNVRDLLKVGDILAGNMQTQLSHMELSEAVVYEQNEARVKSIRTAASMVYCRLFHGREDQVKVQEHITKRFPLSQQELEVTADKISIDSNLPNVTRIGFVYLAKGQADSSFLPLVHTNQLKEQLQLLGCAVASGRAVVLEGGTCSRKTGLICELARQCKRKLHLFSLNAETESDMLIGRWVPFRPVSALQNLVQESLMEFEKILCFILTNFLQSGTPSFLKDVLFYLTESVEKAWSTEDEGESSLSDHAISKAEKVTNAINSLAKVSDLLDERSQFQTTGQLRRKLLRRYTRHLRALSHSLAGKVTAFRSKMTAFEYVESALVTAIRRGEWVILDNISAAPSDVVERLISLTEAVPTLRVYESPESPLLSWENGSMDSNFRLFATVNSSRQSQGKLSSAFYNRVLRIWMPEVDEEAVAISAVSNDLRKTELYTLVLGLLGDLPGAHFLTNILVLVHCRLRRLSFSRQLLTVGGCVFTLRNVLRAARELSRRFRKVRRFSYLNEVLEKCYVKCCVGKDQAKALDEILKVFEKASGIPNLEFTRRNARSTSGNVDDFEEEAFTLKEFAKNIIVGSILAFLGILNFQIKIADSREITKAAAFCQASMLQLARQLGSERDLLEKVEGVKEASTSAELSNSENRRMDVSKKMSMLIASIQMFGQRTGDLTSAENVEKFANQTSIELSDLGVKLRAFLCHSSFNCIQQRLDYINGILIQFQLVRSGVSSESWLTEFTLIERSRKSPEAKKIEGALSALQDGLLSLSQKATVLHVLSYYTSKVSSLNSEVEAAVNEFALESDKPFLLSVFHQIMQQKVVASCERKRLLQFIVEKAVLPPQLLVKLEIFLTAAKILLEAELKIPISLPQSEIDLCGQDGNMGILQTVSVYDNAISACNCLKDAMERFSSSIAPILRRIKAMGGKKSERTRDSVLEATLSADREELHQKLTSSKKQFVEGFSGECVRRVRRIYVESVTSIHSKVFNALAGIVKKQKSLMSLKMKITSMPHVRNLVRQLSAEELDSPFGHLWLAAFFGLNARVLTSSEGLWQPFLVLSENDVKSIVKQSKCPRKMCFVCEGGFGENEAFSFCVVVINEATEKAFFVRASDDDLFGNEAEGERNLEESFSFHFPTGEGQMDESTLTKRILLRNEFEKCLRSAKMKIQHVSVWCERGRETKRAVNHEILLVTSSLESVISGNPKNTVKVQETVFTQLSGSVEAIAKQLKPYCYPSDRQKCLKETMEAVNRFLVLHERVEFTRNWEEEHEREGHLLQGILGRLSENFERTQDMVVPRSIRQRHQLLSRIGRTLDRRLTEINVSNEDELPWDVRVLWKLERKIHDVGSAIETKRLSAADKVVRMVRNILHRSVRFVCDLTDDSSPCWVSEADGRVSFEGCFSLPVSNAGLQKLSAALSFVNEACTKLFRNFRMEGDSVDICPDNLLSDADCLAAVLKTFEGLLPSFYETVNFSLVLTAAKDCVREFQSVKTEIPNDAYERQSEAQEHMLSVFVENLSRFHREAVSFTSPPLQFLLRLKRTIHDVKVQYAEHGPGSADIKAVLQSKGKAFSKEFESLKKRESVARNVEFSFEAEVRQSCPDITMGAGQSKCHSTNRDLINEVVKAKCGNSFDNVKQMTELFNVVAGYAIEESRLRCVVSKLLSIRKSLMEREGRQLVSVTSEDRIALAELVAVTGIGERAEAYLKLADELFEDEFTLENLDILLEKLCNVFFQNRRRTLFSEQWQYLCSYSAVLCLCKPALDLVDETKRTVSNAAVLYRRTRERCKALEKFKQHLTKNDVTSIRPLFLGVSDMYFILFPGNTRFLHLLNVAEESLADHDSDWQNVLWADAETQSTDEREETSGFSQLLLEEGYKADTFFSYFSRFIRALSSDLKDHIDLEAKTLRTYLDRKSLPEIHVCAAAYGLFLCKWLFYFMSSGFSSNSFKPLTTRLASSSKQFEENYNQNIFLASKRKESEVKKVLSDLFETPNVFSTVDDVFAELCDAFDVTPFQVSEAHPDSPILVAESELPKIRLLFKSLLLFASNRAGDSASKKGGCEGWEKPLLEKCSKASQSLSLLIETFKSNFSLSQVGETVLAPIRLLKVCWTSLEGALADVSRKAAVFRKKIGLEHDLFRAREKGVCLEAASQLLVEECKNSSRKYNEYDTNVSKLLNLSHEFILQAEEVASWTSASLLLYRASEVATSIAALTFLYMERRDKGNSYLRGVERKLLQHDSKALEKYSRLNVESQLASVRVELACLVSQLKSPLEAFVFCHLGNPYSLLEEEISIERKLKSFWAVLGEACANLASKLECVCREVDLVDEGRHLVKSVLKDLLCMQSQKIEDDVSNVASCSDRLSLSTTQLSLFLSAQKNDDPAEKVQLTARYISLKVVGAGISVEKENLRKAFARFSPVGIRAEDLELWHILQPNLLSDDTLCDLWAFLRNEDGESYGSLRLLTSFLYEGSQTLGDSIHKVLCDSPLLKLDVNFVWNVLKKFQSCCNECMIFLKQNLCSHIRFWRRKIGFEKAESLLEVFAEGPMGFFESGLSAYYNHCQSRSFCPTLPEKYEEYRLNIEKLKEVTEEAMQRWISAIYDKVEEQSKVCRQREKTFAEKFWDFFKSQKAKYDRDMAVYTKAKEEHEESRKTAELYLVQALHILSSLAKIEGSDQELYDRTISILQEYNGLLLKSNCTIDNLFCVESESYTLDFSEMCLEAVSTDVSFCREMLFFFFENGKKFVFPVSFSSWHMRCACFSLSEKAVKSLTLVVDDDSYKVTQSTFASMCSTPVATEAVVVHFRSPKSAITVAVTFKCISKFRLSVSENFEPLMNSVEDLRKCLSECLEGVKSALKKHKWEPVPLMPTLPSDKAGECKDKTVFQKEKERIESLSREVERKSLEFCVNVIETFKAYADCDTSPPLLSTVSYNAFKKCREGLRIMPLENMLSTINEGNSVIRALNDPAPNGRFLFLNEKFPSKAVAAGRDLINAASALQDLLTYEFYRSHTKQLSLLLLCCLTANNGKELDECQSLLRTAADDLAKSEVYFRTGSLQSLQNRFTGRRESLLNFSRLFCDWKRKSAWISQTFASPRVEFDLLSFENRTALLESAVPSLHLLDNKDSVLVPSLKSFVIKMRCSNANPESMLVRFCIYNDSIAVKANYQVESMKDADTFSEGFEMVPSSGTINPLSKVEIAVAFCDSVSSASFHRRALRRSYTLKIWSTKEEYRTLLRQIEFLVEGTLESVNDCIIVSSKTINFGVIDIKEKPLDVKRLLTLTNRASTDVKFQIISVEGEKCLPSIVVKCAEHALASYEVEHIIPSCSSIELSFFLKLGANPQPKRFSKHYTIRFSSEKEISVCARGQLIQPFVVGYDNNTGSKLEDSSILYVPKASDKQLTFYNSFSVPALLSPNLGRGREDFRLEPSGSQFLVLPRTSQRISLQRKVKENCHSSVLNVRDGVRAEHYSVIPDNFLADTHSVYDCDVKFCSDKSDNIPIPKVALELWLRSRFFEEEEVEIWSDTLELCEHEVLKLKLKQRIKETVKFQWRPGSLLQTKGSFICRRLQCGQDISAQFRINFRNQVTNFDMTFTDKPNVVCALVDAQGGNINALFKVKTECRLMIDGGFSAVGAESFEISKTRVKQSGYFSFFVDKVEERQVHCFLKSEADWYGLSIKICPSKSFVGYNGKAFSLWRKLYMVGKPSNSKRLEPLGKRFSSPDVESVRCHLAEAANEESFTGIIRHLTVAFFRLTDNSSGEFGVATNFPQFLKAIESFDQNSTEKAVILSLLKYAQSFEKAEFGVLLAMKEEISISWLAEALVYPNTQTLSPFRWILTSSIKFLSFMASAIVAEQPAKESFQHFLLLLEKYDNVCHRLPQEPSKKLSLLAISELILKNAKKEDFLGVLWGKFYGRKFQNSTDFLNWVSEFNSLGDAKCNRRICSINLLKCSVKLSCCPVKACDIAFYIAEAVHLSSSQINNAWFGSARLALLRLGDTLNQNPLTFPSIDSLFQLFCGVISCLNLSSDYKIKVKRVLMLFPVAWKSTNMNEIYCSLFEIIATFASNAFPCSEGTEQLSKFLLDLAENSTKQCKNTTKQCILSYSNLLVSWLTLRDRKALADVISNVTKEAIYRSAHVTDWKRFFVDFDPENVPSASAMCSKFCKVFQTKKPLFSSMEILRDIGELFLNDDSKSFTTFGKIAEELVKENIGLQPCGTTLETLAALVNKSHGEQFHSALKNLASQIRQLDRALSIEDNSQPLCSMRQSVSFEAFQLASSVLYCQSFGSSDDAKSFQSIKGLLNRGFLSDKLSQVMKATLIDLPTALMSVAVVFFPGDPNDITDACEPYIEKEKQLLETKLNLEEQLAKIVIIANKRINAKFKRFLVDNLFNFVQALKTKTVSKVLRIAHPDSKQWDEMAIREALVEIDWYGFTASDILSFIAKSSTFDDVLTECLATSNNVAQKLQQISSDAASLLPDRWAINISSFISSFVSNLLLLTELDNLGVKAVVYIFDNMLFSTNKANCDAQSFDLAFSIAKRLLFIGNLSIPKEQWNFAEFVLSFFQEAPSFELASLIDDLCSGDFSCAEKDVLLALGSSCSKMTGESNERSWKHVVCFLRKLASMKTVTVPVSKAIKSVVNVCCTVFKEESHIRHNHLMVFDLLIKCAKAVECTLEFQSLLFDVKKYFSLLCQTHWQLPICQETQEVVKELLKKDSFEIEKSITAVTDLADSLGLIENRKRQDDYNVLFKMFYSLSQSLECGSSEVIALCGTVVSLAVNHETTLAIEPSDVILLLEFFHGCWKLSKDQKSFAKNWETYVAYSIGALLTWLNSPMSRKRELQALTVKDERTSSLAKAVVKTPLNPKWISLRDEEFVLNLADKPTYSRSFSTESEGSSKVSSNSVEDLSMCGVSDESDSDDTTEKSFLVRSINYRLRLIHFLSGEIGGSQ